MNRAIYGDFYNPDRALSYHRPFIVSIGSRSIGKTTGWLLYAVDRALNEGKKFIYIRRYDDDVRDVTADLLKNVEIIFHNANLIPKTMSFVYVHRKFFAVDGKTKIELGTAQALNTSEKAKSAVLGSLGYDLGIYDECISKNPHKYLPDEYKVLLDYYITVARCVGNAHKRFTMVCIGNAASYNCPIIEGIGADKFLTEETRYLAPKGKPWVLEQTAQVKATEGGDDFLEQMLPQNEIDYNLHGKTLDSKQFLTDIPCIHPIFACEFRGVYIGVYREGDYVVCSSRRNELPVTALTYADGGINREYEPTKASIGRVLQEFAKNGRLLYTNSRIQHAIMTYMRFI